MTELFSPDYATARQRFHEAAGCAGGALEEIPLEARDPQGRPLGITIVRLGTTAPRQLLVHLAGVHGLEAFLGAAIQLDLLRRPPDLPSDTALALVHVVNPYGMAWLRRGNGDNVDLNRNLLLADEPFAGCPEAYHRLADWLNPRRIGGTPGFYASAAAALIRHGYRNLKQAVAGGQYAYPEGLFYGGSGHAAELRQLVSWLSTATAGVERVLAVDVHSGLGRFGGEALLTFHAPDSPAYKLLRDRWGDRVSGLSATGVAYEVRGSVLGNLPQLVPQPQWVGLGQEFGTYPGVRVLRALREENWLHFHAGQPWDGNHPIKRRAREMFCPADPSWRQRIVACGRDLVGQMLTLPGNGL